MRALMAAGDRMWAHIVQAPHAAAAFCLCAAKPRPGRGRAFA